MSSLGARSLFFSSYHPWVFGIVLKYPFSFKIDRMIVVVDGKTTVGNFISITPIFVVQ